VKIRPQCLTSFYPLPSPDGVYYEPYIGCIGDSYIVFDKGSYLWRMPQSLEADKPVGTYKREGRRWLLSDLHGHWMPLSFKATVLGIKLDSPTADPPQFLYRRCFAWIPKTREWLRSRLS
jgi:hypothetical protein